MDLTSRMALNGQLAAQKMSKKAFSVYASLSPFRVYEYDTPHGKRYSYRGMIGDVDNLSFLELESVLENLYDLLK